MPKAYAKQLPLTETMAAQVRAQNKLVGNQKDRGKVTLAQLRESLKAQSRRTASKKARTVMEDIKTRYGNRELQRAIREFNITFRGIERDPEEGRHPPTKTFPASGPRGK